MRTGIAIIASVLISFSAMAQTATPDEPATMPKKMAVNENQDRIVVDFTFDNWFHKQSNGFETEWFSRGMGIYFMYDVPIKGSNVSFAPGLGFNTSAIFHNSTLFEDSTSTSFAPIANYENDDTYKKNKLALSYVDIPLELRYRSNPDKRDNSFKVALGMKFGLRVDVHTKTKRVIGEDTKVFKEKRFSDFSIFRVGPTFRIGYGAFNVVAYYSLLSPFKNDQGPSDIKPFSIGISFNGL